MYRNLLLGLTASSILALTAALPVTFSTPTLACSSHVTSGVQKVDRNRKKIAQEKVKSKRDVGASKDEAEEAASEGKPAFKPAFNMTRC